MKNVENLHYFRMSSLTWFDIATADLSAKSPSKQDLLDFVAKEDYAVIRKFRTTRNVLLQHLQNSRHAKQALKEGRPDESAARAPPIAESAAIATEPATAPVKGGKRRRPTGNADSRVEEAPVAKRQRAEPRLSRVQAKRALAGLEKHPGGFSRAVQSHEAPSAAATQPLTTNDPKALNEWTVSGKVGEGAYGRVYTVTGPTQGSWVAKVEPASNKINLLNKERLVFASLFQGLYINQGLYHPRSKRPIVPRVPSIKSFYGTTADKQWRYLVMERLQPLGALRENVKPLLRYIMADVLLTLKHLHAKNRFHLDIKPDNIMWQAYEPTLQNSDGSIPRTQFYLVDYGASETKSVMGDRAFQNGSDAYKSLKQHAGAPIDAYYDLVPLALTLVDLHSRLPWLRAKNAKEMVDMKRQALSKRAFDLGDPVVTTFVNEVVQETGVVQHEKWIKQVYF